MPVNIIGLNWRGGKFVHSFDITDIPHRPGVFKLHYQEDDGQWTVFFVGETRNLWETLVFFLTTADIDPRIRTRVAAARCGYSYAVVPDADLRKAALRSLYDYFKPELNDPKSIPQVEGLVEVNPN